MAMEAAANFIGLDGLTGLAVAVQGCGNVGRPLIRFLLEKKVARVIGAEANKLNYERAQKEFADVGERVEIRHCPFGDKSILEEKVDIVSPNAWGGILDQATCERIQAKIVCGAANSQLLKGDEGKILHNRDIIYVPDFVANPMGIVNCANEMYGRVGKLGTEDDPEISRRLGKEYKHSVYNTTLAILKKTREKKTMPPDVQAVILAKELMRIEHPIW